MWIKIILYIIKRQQIHKIYSIRWKKKKLPARFQVGQRGERKNIANNCKVRNRNNETPKNCIYIYSGNFRLWRRWYEQKEVVNLGETQILLFYFILFLYIFFNNMIWYRYIDFFFFKKKKPNRFFLYKKNSNWLFFYIHSAVNTFTPQNRLIDFLLFFVSFCSLFCLFLISIFNFLTVHNFTICFSFYSHVIILFLV